MGLQDGHHYVRRTAVLGVLKVYNLDASAVRNAGGSCVPSGGCSYVHERLSADPRTALGCMQTAVGGLHVVEAGMRCCWGLQLTSIAPFKVLASTVASVTPYPPANCLQPA